MFQFNISGIHKTTCKILISSPIFKFKVLQKMYNVLYININIYIDIS